MCVCSATLSFLPQAPSTDAAPPQANPPAIRVESSLELVDAITQDPKNGLAVRDLQKSDFRIFDNGHEVPISTFDAGAHFDTRPVIIWLTVICNEGKKVGGSARYAANEALFRPALDHLEKNDTVGVAHRCDNGETALDLLPTADRDRALQGLADTIKPISFVWDPSADPVGEKTFRKVVRLIIQNANHRNPQPLPIIVFLDGDHTGQPRRELDDLVDDFLETSGIVFGIKDSLYPRVPPSFIGERAEILHYMARQTGGQYFAVAPEEYSIALQAILTQLHFRYQLGFLPTAIDGKRHQLEVELTKEGREKHKGVRQRFRPEYIPIREVPEWAR